MTYSVLSKAEGRHTLLTFTVSPPSPQTSYGFGGATSPINRRTRFQSSGSQCFLICQCFHYILPVKCLCQRMDLNHRHTVYDTAALTGLSYAGNLPNLAWDKPQISPIIL